MRSLPPANEPAGNQCRGTRKFDSRRVVLAMQGLLAYLSKWCCLPVMGGFAELDIQIGKLRMLRDSYQEPPQIRQYGQASDTNKEEKKLCIQQ